LHGVCLFFHCLLFEIKLKKVVRIALLERLPITFAKCSSNK